MQLKIGLIIFLQMLVFADVFTKYGFINIQTWENLNIYVDDKFKGVTGEGTTKLKLSKGSHKIKVDGYSNDGNWYYSIEKTKFIGEDMEIKTTLIPIKYPTEKKQKEISKSKAILEYKLNTIYTLGIHSIDIKNKHDIYQYKKESLKKYLKIKKEPFNFLKIIKLKGKDLIYNKTTNEKIMESSINTVLKPILVNHQFLIIKIINKE